MNTAYKPAKLTGGNDRVLVDLVFWDAVVLAVCVSVAL